MAAAAARGGGDEPGRRSVPAPAQGRERERPIELTALDVDVHFRRPVALRDPASAVVRGLLGERLPHRTHARASAGPTRARSATLAGMRRYGTPPETLLAPSAYGGAAALKLPGRDASRRSTSTSCARRRARRWCAASVSTRSPRSRRTATSTSASTSSSAATCSAGYVGSTDLLTHVLHGSDFASDTCIRRGGDDPATGGRYLEELAFEVVHEQPLKKVTERAEDWSRRGVRRVIGIFVKKGTVEEWQPEGEEAGARSTPAAPSAILASSARSA